MAHFSLVLRYHDWARLASTMLGGLDILTVDAIHDTKTGAEWILEVNGTSSGLAPLRAAEDNREIADLVLSRLNLLFCSPTPPRQQFLSLTNQPSNGWTLIWSDEFQGISFLFPLCVLHPSHFPGFSKRAFD